MRFRLLIGPPVNLSVHDKPRNDVFLIPFPAAFQERYTGTHFLLWSSIYRKGGFEN
jgi:hypothetical protein